MLSLQHQRMYTDLLLTYKCKHGLMIIPAYEVELRLTTSNIRSNGVHLVYHRPFSKKCAALFSCRIPLKWNVLPINILQAETPSSKNFYMPIFSTPVIMLTFTSCFYDLFYPNLILYRKAYICFCKFELE